MVFDADSNRIGVVVGVVVGMKILICQCVKVLRLTPAHRGDRLVGRLAFGFVTFFQNRTGEVGGILSRRRRETR